MPSSTLLNLAKNLARRIVFTVLLTLPFCGMLAGTSARAAEMLLNAGLESPYVSGVATNWVKDPSGAASMTCSQETTIIHGGSSSQKIVSSGVTTNSQAIFMQPFTQVNGHVYQASVWVKSSTANMPVQMELRSWQGTYFLAGATCLTNVGTNWQQIIIKGGWRSSTSNQFVVNLRTNGTFYVDDASLTDVTSTELSTPIQNTGTIPASFMGMHVNKESSTWPGVNQGLVRLWDTGTSWAAVETASNSYSWTKLDFWVNYITNNNPNCKILYTMGQSPQWAASSLSVSNIYGIGAQSPPKNINDWSNYVHTVAARYKGVIKYYEVWNETDYNGFYVGSAAQLVQLTQYARGALDAVDPSNTLFSPTITVNGLPWLENLLQAGCGQYVDAIAYHAYSTTRPEDDLGVFAGLKDMLSRHPDVSSLPIWNTEGAAENGSTTSQDEGIVSRFYLADWASGMQNANWYTWDIFGVNVHLSYTNSSGTYIGMTNGGIAYSNTAWWLSGAQMNSRTVDSSTNWVTELQRPDPLHSGAFLKSGHVVWNPDNNSVTYSIPSSWNVYQKRDLTAAVTAISGSTVSVGQAPIILDGKVANAPGGLSATGGVSQVTLNWSVATGASGYNVKRSTTSGGPYTFVANVTGTGYTNTGLATGTTYYYVVSSTNYVGEGADSGQVSAATSLPAPTGLMAMGGTNQVSLSWNSVSGASSYNLKHSTTNGGPYTTVTNTTSTADIDTGLSAGTTYYYVVSALAGGSESSNSGQVSAITTPPAPTSLAATGGADQISLSWHSAAGESSYNVKRSASSGGPYTTVTNTTSTADVDTGLASGTIYYYVVSALNGSGESGNSSQASALTIPAAPTGLTATSGDTQVSLNWTGVSGATSYNVKRSLTSGGTYTTVTGGNTSGTAFTDTTVTNGTTFFYEISALDATGEGPNSAFASATPPLTGVNVGFLGAAGNFSASVGTYTINGGGTNVYQTNDSFYFAYRALTGDVEVVTHVLSVSNTSTYAKAGIMIRETLASNSAVVATDVTPGYGLEFIRRYSTGGVSTNTLATGLTAPYWLKLVRTSDTISAYRSTNGVDWVLSGSDVVNMAPTVYVGMLVCAQSSTVLCTATFDNFSAGDPWNSVDIGATGAPGGANVDPTSGTFTAWGAGTDIYALSDQFQYVNIELYTNAQVVARVVNVGTNTSVWAKGGIMIRQSIGANDTNVVHATVDVMASKGLEFIRRYTTGGSDTNIILSGYTAPYWVMLTRTNGTNFTASSSPDGVTWTVVGSDVISVTNPAYVGLIVCSHNNGVLCTNVFDHVTVTPTP